MPPQSIQEHKEAVLKEFENHFRIADGILELWEQVLPDGDWDVKTASMNDLKSFLSRALDKAYKAGAESIKDNNAVIGGDSGQ